jgi:hypothetical protein
MCQGQCGMASALAGAKGDQRGPWLACGKRADWNCMFSVGMEGRAGSPGSGLQDFCHTLDEEAVVGNEGDEVAVFGIKRDAVMRCAAEKQCGREQRQSCSRDREGCICRGHGGQAGEEREACRSSRGTPGSAVLDELERADASQGEAVTVNGESAVGDEDIVKVEQDNFRRHKCYPTTMKPASLTLIAITMVNRTFESLQRCETVAVTDAEY